LVVALALGAVGLDALGVTAPREDEDPPPPAPVVALTPDRVPDADEHACSECHARVVDEWASTAHAVAWLDEHYQAAIAERKRPELCHGCHIPAPLLAEAELPRRVAPRPAEGAEPLIHGVSCEACHLAPDGAFLGPTGAPTEAHATRVDARLTAEGSSKLCAACHRTSIGPVVGIAKDFEKANLAARGMSCVGCHMGAIEVDGRRVRSHAIQTPRDPAFLRRAFEVSLSPGSGVTVSIANRAGHRVPGLIGRSITLRAELLDAAGVVVATEELTLDAKAYIPVEGTKELVLDGAGAAVRVQGEHVDPRAAEPMSFLDVRLELGE
jgi:hypothetical protein